MLSFGLTLLGGCVSTTAQGQPSELYFLTHSVRSRSAGAALYANAPNLASVDNMAARAHRGILVLENIIKTGARSSFAEWGVYPDTPGIVYSNSLFVSLCAKNDLPGNNDYRTNINGTRASAAGTRIGSQPSLYTTGTALNSPSFYLMVQNGIMTVTDSFSGQEKTHTITIPDIYSDGGGARVFIWGSETNALFDFVVNAYNNAGLGVNRLTLPMRQYPAPFRESLSAVFEFETKTFIGI